eukprot:26121-Pyramimonas_sp.AAC.1
MCFWVAVSEEAFFDREKASPVGDRDVLDAMHTATPPIGTSGARGRVDYEAHTRPATARVKMASHEQPYARGLVEIRRGLADVRAETYPEDT